MEYFDIRTNNSSLEAVARAYRRQEAAKMWACILVFAAILTVIPFWAEEVRVSYEAGQSFFPSARLIAHAGGVIALIGALIVLGYGSICLTKRVVPTLRLDKIEDTNGWWYYRVTFPDGTWKLTDLNTFETLRNSPLSTCSHTTWRVCDKLEHCSYTYDPWGITVRIDCEFSKGVGFGMRKWLLGLDAYWDALRSELPKGHVFVSPQPVPLQSLVHMSCKSLLTRNGGFLSGESSVMARDELPDLAYGCKKISEHLEDLCQQGVISDFKGSVTVEYPKIGQSRTYALQRATPPQQASGGVST